jgi:hypothetical protein
MAAQMSNNIGEEDIAYLPEQFRDLEVWMSKWSLPTQAERARLRHSSSAQEMKTFYSAVLPHLGNALIYLREFPLTDLPTPAKRLLFLLLSLAEVSTFVEFYDCSNTVPNAFAEARLVAVHRDSLAETK